MGTQWQARLHQEQCPQVAQPVLVEVNNDLKRQVNVLENDAFHGLFGLSRYVRISDDIARIYHSSHIR